MAYVLVAVMFFILGYLTFYFIYRKTLLAVKEGRELLRRREEEYKAYIDSSEGHILNRFIDSLNDLQREVDEVDRKVKATIQVVRETSQVLEGSQSELHKATQLIDESSRVVSDSLQNVESISSQLDMAAQSLASNVEVLSQTISTIEYSTSEAETSLLKVEKSIGDEVRHINEDSARLKELERAVGDIEAIVDHIESIAGKTKLLSLNASIEAARAGEAGKGFSVVAMEIRKLADSSRLAAEEVRETVKRLVELIHDAYSISLSRIEDVSKLRELVIATNDKVRMIMDSIEKVDIMGSDLAAVSQELSASVTEVSDSIKRINNTMDSLVHSIRHLSSVEQGIDKIRNMIGDIRSSLEA